MPETTGENAADQENAANNPRRLAHLHAHSDYSLMDGAIRVGELLSKAKEFGHEAVALTDHGNLFGAIEFYTKAKKEGIKPIIGSEIFHAGSPKALAYAKARGHANAGAFHLVLLARNNTGYHNLIKVVSAGYLKGLGEVPVSPQEDLDQYGGEQIALSSCMRGEFGYLVREIREHCGSGELRFDLTDETGAMACEALAEHVELMEKRVGKGHYYVELIDNNLPEQRKHLEDLVTAARHFGLPLVATADAHYLEAEHSEMHAVLIGIKHGLTMSQLRSRLKQTRFHLLNNQEMEEIYGAWPEALDNTAAIADACNIEFSFDEYYLPQFDTGTDENAADGLRRMAREMLEDRFTYLEKCYGPSFDEEKKKQYRERLEYELGVITDMGFPGYFLIVQDFINWAKEHGIPVGPGRGSGAGSLVAYALRITDLDPIPYNLIFERFLNPERVSMPDFDVDFCQFRRDEVIEYVTEKYGEDNVAQIITFGKMNAKAVVRDVGRVLELSYNRVDKIAKLIPDDLGITLDEAMQQEPKLGEEAEREEVIADLLRIARQLEGLSRHSSVHAAGVVISDGPMTDYVPVYTTEEDGLITQFEMKMAEKVGLVKFDFLGLKTLTVIDKAVDLIRKTKKDDFDISLIPMDDRDTFKMIDAAHTIGVFQLESRGMRQLIAQLLPNSFEEIIALVALFRPGPLNSGMAADFIERKHGRQKIEYPHPWLEPILSETYGTILYQEQVMKIAGEMASYSLGEADLLRRAMGKKIASEMEKQKERFISGAVDNGIDKAKATEIFDLMAEFAAYGFNKSHSAAYGLVSYQTAYLKCHYPAEFMAAIMTCDIENTKKIVAYIEECRRMGLKILPPDINRSRREFDVPEEGAVGIGLWAVKGIGEAVLEPIVRERQDNGPYKSLTDLARRVNLTKVGKKTLELLVQVGALDTFGISRAKLTQLVGETVKFSEAHHEAKSSGQRGLFDMEEDTAAEDPNTPCEIAWNLAPADKQPGAPDPTWLKKEKKLLGVFLTGHPMDFYRQDQKAFGQVTTRNLAKFAGKKNVAIVALLSIFHERLTKNGNRMASIRLEDGEGACEAVMFGDDVPQEMPDTDQIVVAAGSIDLHRETGEPRFILNKIEPLEDFRQERVEAARVTIDPGGNDDDNSASPGEDPDAAHHVERLKSLFESHRGDTPVKLTVAYPEAELTVNLENHPVHLTDAFLTGLRNLPFRKADVQYQLFSASSASAS